MSLFLGNILLLVAAVTLFVHLSPQFGRAPSGEHLKRISASPQYRPLDRGGHFENVPKAEPKMTLKQSFEVLGKLLFDGDDLAPPARLPSAQPTFDRESGAWLTWFGHSTFLYEVDGKRLLLDPMLGQHASPVPGIVSRYPYTLPSSAAALPHLDAVLVSHDHYDHLDHGTILELRDKTDRFIVPLGVGSHLQRWGVPAEKITELDWWSSTTLGSLTITAAPSQHFSGRALTDRMKTLWAAWAIKSTGGAGSPGANVFFGGDSGYFPGFPAIGEKLGPFDLTLLDSGQYDEKWKEVHMLPEQAVAAHGELRGKVLMPIHWSAFTLAVHPWSEPAERSVAAAEKAGVDVVTPGIGERFDVLTERPQKKWWREIVAPAAKTESK